MGLISHWIGRLTVWLVVGFMFGHAYRVILLYRRREKFKNDQGVRQAAWIPQTWFLWGLDMAQGNLKAIEEHRFLDHLDDYFRLSNRTTLQCYNAGRHMHITIEPENLRTIQSTDHQKWRFNKTRKEGFSLLLGKGIFTVDGLDWKISHDLLRPSFERLQVINLHPSESHVSSLLSRIPTDGSVVDLSKLFFYFSMDVSTELLFGTSTDSQRSIKGQQFSTAFGRSQNDASKRAHLGWWYYILKPLAAKNAINDVETVHRFVDSFVERAIADATLRDEQKQSRSLPDSSKLSRSEIGRYVFLDELVKLVHDPSRIRSELLNVLLAGRDTTASLLTNLWFILSKRPDVWSKLQTEVSTLRGKKPTYVQLREMRYLQALMNESLRLYPVVPYNTREAAEDTILPLGGGSEGKDPIFIKKGELVAWSLYSMHRRKDLWGEDADAFIPERWLCESHDSDGSKVNRGWEFLPFHAGPRACMGQAYAKTQVAYVTVRLCQEFHMLESASESEWEEDLALTLINFHGAKVYLGTRHGDHGVRHAKI